MNLFIVNFINPLLITHYLHPDYHNLVVVKKAKNKTNNRIKKPNKPSQVFSVVLSELPQNYLKSFSSGKKY